LLALALFLKSFVDLILDPFASDLMFRHDQNNLVAKSNGLIDPVKNFGADRQIMRREPAPHAPVLEV
jgi:hypothetical protein